MSSKFVEKFVAKSDSGRTYTISVFQEWIETSSHDDDERIPGLKRLVTSDGHRVNCIDAKTFQVVDTGEIVRRV